MRKIQSRSSFKKDNEIRKKVKNVTGTHLDIEVVHNDKYMKTKYSPIKMILKLTTMTKIVTKKPLWATYPLKLIDLVFRSDKS